MKTVNRKASKVNQPALVLTKDLGPGIFMPVKEGITPEQWSEARVRLLMLYLDAMYPQDIRKRLPVPKPRRPKAGKPSLSLIDGGLSA